MTNFRRRLGWIALGLFVFLVAAVVTVRVLFNSYLNSEGFRQKITNATADELKAEAEFQPLHFSGASVYSDGFVARGTEASFFSELQVQLIRADFNWHGLLRRAWQIDQLELQRLDIDLGGPRVESRPRAPRESKTEPSGAGGKLDLRRANVRESRWSWGGGDVPAGAVTGAALTLIPSGEAWLIEAQGGKLTQAGWPESQLEKARLRYQSPSLFINESTLREGDGTVNTTGEINFEREANLQVQAAGVKVWPLLSEDWRARLSGRIFADAKIHVVLGKADHDSISAEGSVRLADGELTALPVLDQIAIFTQTQRFRRLSLTKASADFSRDRVKTVARHVLIEAEGLLRIEGGFTIENGDLNGAFQVGVTPSSLQWLPGSRDHVFTTARGGYLWTPMQLTGALEHPVEDLTPRLVEAAANSVLKKVEETLHDGTKGVREGAKGVLDLLLH